MVLSGMNTYEQVKDNIRTFDHLTPISPKETIVLGKVAEIISRSIAVPWYCMPVLCRGMPAAYPDTCPVLNL